MKKINILLLLLFCIPFTIFSTEETSKKLTRGYSTTLYNNGPENATNFIFYDSSNVALSGSLTLGDAQVPSGSVKGVFNMFGSTLTCPASTAGDVIDIFGSGKIVNKCSSTVSVIYSGNNANNNPAIPISANANVPIITDTTTVTIYDSNGAMSVPQTSINANTTYYIYNTNGEWELETSPRLTNNYTTTATDLYFFDSNKLKINSTPETISAGQYISIPNNASYINCNMIFYGVSVILAVPLEANKDVNIFGNGSITNTNNSNVVVVYIGTINGTETALNSLSGIPIPTNCSIPIITSATKVSIYENTTTYYKSTPTIDDDLSYYIDSYYNLSTTEPVKLTNNSNQATGTISFTTSTGEGAGGGTSSLGAYSSVSIPSNTSLINASGLVNGSSFKISLFWTGVVSTNIYTNYDLINNTTGSVNLTCYYYMGSPTYVQSGTITLTAGQSIKIITGTAAITINGTSINQQSILSNSSYIINNTNGTWSLTPYTPTKLTNNFNQATGSVTFYNSSGGTISTVSSIAAWSSADIPSGTTSITATGLVNNSSFTFPTTYSNMNIYTNYVLTNNTPDDIGAWFYSSTAYVSPYSNPSGSLTIKAGQSIQIINDTVAVQFDYQDEPVAIATNSSYMIDGTDIYSFLAYTPTLFNYYTTDASNLNYYGSNSAFISSQDTIPANGGTAPTPGNAYSAKLTALLNSENYDLTIPIYFPYQPIYTGNTITNNYIESIKVTYYGTVNGINNVALNSTPIIITGGQNIPIIIGASNLTIVDSNGNSTGISGYTITGGVNYYVNNYSGTWNISTYPPFELSNNYTQNAEDLLFYDSDRNNVGFQEYLPAGAVAPIPANAVYAEIDDLDGTLQFSVSGSVNSNLFGAGTLTNNSFNTATVTVNYLGTINGIADSSINFTKFTLAPGASIPIVTGTSRVDVYDSSGTTTLTSDDFISADTSYFINYDTDLDQWSISTSSSINKLYNNYTTTAANLMFFDTTSVQQGLTTPSFAPGGSVIIPETSVYASVEDLETTLFTPVSYNANSDLFGTGSLTNNATTSVSVIYYGTLNGTDDTQLNTDVIVIAPGAMIPIITGTSLVNLYDSTGTNILIDNETIDADTKYYIYNTSGTWTIETFNSTYTLTNNSNKNISGMTIYDSSTNVITTIDQLLAWQSTQIPTNATFANFTIPSYGENNNVNMNTLVSGNISSNIFENYVLYNNSDLSVNVQLSATINGNEYNPLTNPNNITLLPNDFIPIITGTMTITISANDLTTTNTTIESTTSYLINDSLSLTAYTPTLVNNYSTDASNLNFYSSNNAFISPTIDPFSAGAEASVPGNATFATMTNLGSTIKISASMADTSYVFTNNTVTNNSEQTIAIIFYGTVNEIETALNSPGISVSAGQSIPIITGSVSISATAGSVLVIPETEIASDTSYFITMDVVNNVDTWTLTTTLPLSSFLLTNNYNAEGTNLLFASSIDTQIGTIQGELAAYASAIIPINATTATLTFDNLSSNITVPVSESASSNIFSSFVIYNNSTDTIGLIFYGTLNDEANLPLNSSAISVAPSQSTPIITGSANVGVSVSGTTVIAPFAQGSIESSTSYFVNHINDVWTLTPYKPVAISTLTNNYSQNASDLIFRNANDTGTGGQDTFNAYSSADIPLTTATAELNDLSSTLTFAVSDTVSSNLFSNYYITNQAGENITVVYYDSSLVQINNPAIACANNASTPIITAAAYYSIFDSSDVEQITQYPIAPNTSYIINGDWTTDPVDPVMPTFTNNYSQDATNLMFYDIETNQVGSIIATLQADSYVAIPSETVSATLTSLGSAITISLSDSVSSDLFTNYFITNQAGENISVIYYDSSSTPLALNDPAISCIDEASTPIITTAAYFSIYDNSDVEQVTLYPIIANTSYIIHEFTADPIVDPVTDVTLTNNYHQDVVDLTFYNVSNSPTAGPNPFDAYSYTVIPADSISATLVETFNDIDATITILLSDTISSNIFTDSFITNQAAQTIGVIYYNSSSEAINNPAISLLDDTNAPIITGAAYFSIFDSQDFEQITLHEIEANTSYVINEFSSTPITGNVLLTNNYETASELTFYDSENIQVGSTTAIFSAGLAVEIPENATTATLVETFNNIDSTMTCSVNDTVASNVFTNNAVTGTPYTVTNNSPYAIDLIFYGTINSTLNTELNNPEISAAIGAQIPIISGTGTQTISVTYDSEVVINQAVINPNTLYYVNYNQGVWTFDDYASTATLTNNYDEDAVNLIFKDSTNLQIGATQEDFLAFSSAPTPSTATTATFTEFSSTITIPVSGSSLSTVFANGIITNNSGETISITFSGTLNSNSADLNTPPITILAGRSTPILTGSTSVSVLDENFDRTDIDETAVDSSLSYYVTYDAINDVWNLTQYTSSALLTNNYNSSATNLIFYDETDTATSTLQSFNAFGSAAIPTNSTTAQFTDFEADFTIPVIDFVSSNVFVNYTINNKSDQTIGIIFYGTVNGTQDSAFNTSISVAAGASIPIPSNTVSLKVNANSFVVIDTLDLVDALPLIVSYDITHNNNTWAITPEVLSLTNNFSAQARTITYYNSEGSEINADPYTSIQPWATIPIPVQARSVIVQYPSVNVTLPLSTQNSSKVFAPHTLINHADEDVFVIFYGTLNGIANATLNDEPFLLEQGQFIPFITGTSSVSIIANDVAIIANATIESGKSYEIVQENGFRIQGRSHLTRAASSTLEPSSSALGVIRFLGGEKVDDPNIGVVNLYADNPNLFTQFLYVNLYAQTIVDTTARAGTITAVNSILSVYAASYTDQQNFNYISHLYLIRDELAASKVVLTARYPNSSQQITQFFAYLQKRVNALLV